MFLTQFEVNTKRRASRHVLGSPQRLHAAVLASFPASKIDDGRILWRLDHGDYHRRELWISSPHQPDLSALVEDCGWPTAERWRSADLQPLLTRLAVGQCWRFRLTANPTKSLHAPGVRGKPVPLTEAAFIPWLRAKGEANGFLLRGDESE